MSKHPCFIIATYTIQHYWCMNNVAGESLAGPQQLLSLHLQICYVLMVVYNGIIVLPKLLN